VIVLRDYQEVAIAGVREQLAAVDKTLLVSPTGSGKTVMFSYIASRASQRGKTIGIFAHRAELLEQISGTLKKFNVPHGIIAAGRTMIPRMGVYVISAQTYASRVDRMPVFDLGIIDEAHHCTDGSTWGKCMARSPNAKWIGVTATPERLDGRGLRESFDSMVLGPSVRSLIDIGALCDYRLFAPPGVDLTGVHTVAGDFNRGELAAAVDRPSVTGDAVKHYTQHIRGAPSVVFCVSVAHAEHVAAEFRAAGYAAASVDGKLDMGERARRMGDFAAGRLNILTAADLISEGLDIPGIHGAILLRPTKSLGLYIQQVGRALRPAAGKDRAIIMDHAGNAGVHGLPDQAREWSLDARSRSKRGKLEGPGVRQCERCFCAYEATKHECPECGWIPFSKPRSIDSVDGELTEVNTDLVRKNATIVRLKEQAMAKTIDQLVELGRSRGMKNPHGWATHVIKARSVKQGARNVR
jgi:DNA repair protein RadD